MIRVIEKLCEIFYLEVRHILNGQIFNEQNNEFDINFR